LVPFNAKFSAEDPDYDPLIFDKITTDAALSYLLNIGLRGASRLIKRGRFTEPQSVKEALEHYKTDNSTTLSWIDDKGLDLNKWAVAHTIIHKGSKLYRTGGRADIYTPEIAQTMENLGDRIIERYSVLISDRLNFNTTIKS
jgi:phage/plasmid-associated DNA primase